MKERVGAAEVGGTQSVPAFHLPSRLAHSSPSGWMKHFNSKVPQKAFNKVVAQQTVMGTDV